MNCWKELKEVSRKNPCRIGRIFRNEDFILGRDDGMGMVWGNAEKLFKGSLTSLVECKTRGEEVWEIGLQM